MSRNLSDVIADDVSDVFFNTDDFAVSITYTRGNHSAALIAIVEPDLFEQLTTLGATKIEQRSYLIKADTLIINGSLTLPQIGDTITEGANVFIVPKGNDRPRHEYADENRLILRVNTTLKSGT